MSEDETEYYTTLEVSLELRNAEGQLLAVTGNEPYLRLTASQFEQAKPYPFAYRDSFPVLPGDYRVNVVLRNRATKQYTVAETSLTVPAVGEEPALGDLIFSGRLENDLQGSESQHKTFQIGAIELDPVPDGIFAMGTTAHVATQVVNGTPEHRVRFSVLFGEEVLHSEEVGVVDAETGEVTASLPLMGMEGGDYPVRAELLDASGTVLSSREETLRVSPRSSVPRAGFVYRHSFNADVPGLVDMALGEQLMARGRIDEAEARLRKALAANPELPMARWKLASAVLFKRKADEALELLLPLEEGHPDQIEVVEGLGFAYYLKEDFDRATPYLEHARSLRPPDTSLLNALGDCYQRLRNPEKAKEMFERSLEINPEQEGVKARLALLDGAASR